MNEESSCLPVPATEHSLLNWRKPRTEGKRPTARGGHTTSLVDTDLIFFGGHCYAGNRVFDYYNDTQVLDLETNTWHKVRTGGKEPSPRYGHSATTIDKRIYIFGGRGKKGVCYSDIYFLDTLSWCWVKLASTTAGPCARFGHAQTLVGNKIVISGGWNGKRCFDDMWIFDTTNNTWMKPKVAGRAPVGRHGHSMNLTVDGRIIVFGGVTINEQGHPEYLQDVRCLDIETMVWTRPRVTGVCPRPRNSQSTCMMGKYLISFGGYFPGASEDQEDNLEVGPSRLKQELKTERLLAFDTESLTWSHLPSLGYLPDNLYGHSISKAGAQFIIYGGWGGNRAQEELYVGEISGGIAKTVEELEEAEDDLEEDLEEKSM